LAFAKPFLIFRNKLKIKVMALWNVKIDDQDWKLVYAPGALTHKEIGLGHKTVIIRRFFYRFEHPYLPANLVVNQKGKLCMTPTWEEVHPQTELSDIISERTKVKVRKERIITQKYNVKNDEGDVYVVSHNTNENKWSCNCMGFWRLKNKAEGCKHIKEIKEDLGL
jgi:hypothetical protein